MAQALQSSVLFTRRIGITSKCLQRRQFSRSSPLCAGLSQPEVLQPRIRPQPKQSTVDKSATQRLIKERDDFGLLPETFIMPTGANRPSIFSLDIFKLLWKRFFMHGRDLLGLFLYKYKELKPRPVIRFRATKAIAIGLHQQMYRAFAVGDQTAIRGICTEGIRDTMLSRIQNRKRGERFKWEMVDEGWTRVVSHRATPLPIPNSGIRQAVVRIKTTQKLTRYDRNGNELAGTGRPKPVTEYVVIQKKTIDGKDGRWKIWGTTNETTLAMLEREKEEMLLKYG